MMLAWRATSCQNPILVNPNSREPLMLCLPGIRHFSVPHHRFASGHYHCPSISANILNLPVIRSVYQEAGLYHPQNLVCVHERIQGLVTTKPSDHKCAMTFGSF